MTLSIRPEFFRELQEKCGLADSAFIRALGVTEERYRQLLDGATPTLKEFADIQLGFNTHGVPLVINGNADATEDTQTPVALD